MKKLLLLLFLVSPVHALDLEDIRTEVRLRVKDSGVSTRFTDAQIDSFSNEGQRDVVNATWVIKKSTSITLVSGTTFYSLPTDLIAIGRVTWRNRNIYEATLTKLDSDFNNSAWLDTGGPPQKYYQDPTQSDKIGIYPFPNSASSTGTIKINYFSQGTNMSADSDVPFNGENRYISYHDLIIFYDCYRVHLLEGEIDKATLYRQEYEARVLLMRDRVGSLPGYIPGLSGTRSNP